MNRVQTLSTDLRTVGCFLATNAAAMLSAAAMAWAIVSGAAGRAAEIHTIDERFLPGGAHASLPPEGKEADWILGDYLLRNDRIVAVIAKPVPTRNANMTVRTVGGCVIDLTSVDQPNDQLSCYYPGGGRFTFNKGDVVASGLLASSATVGDRVTASGERVQAIVSALPTEGSPMVEVTYELADGDDFLTVTSRVSNPHDTPVTVELEDRVRADRSFTAAADTAANVAWWDDEWFGQAYGIVPVGAELEGLQEGGGTRNGRDPLRYSIDGQSSLKLAPGDSVELVRRLMPAKSLLALRARAAEMAGQPLRSVTLVVSDAAGGVP